MYVTRTTLYFGKIGIYIKFYNFISHQLYKFLNCSDRYGGTLKFNKDIPSFKI